jgi:hypothetical protein
MSDPKTQTCKRCGEQILWQLTAHGKLTPNNLDGSSHWATCPFAAQFKKPAPEPEPTEIQLSLLDL